MIYKKGWFRTKHQRWDNEDSKDGSENSEMSYDFHWLETFQCQLVTCAHDTVQAPLCLVLPSCIDIPGLKTKSGVKLRSSSRILKENT